MSKTGYDLSLGYAVLDCLPDGREKAVQYAVSGLLADGAHHKQWCLVKVLEALGVKLEDVRADLPGYDIEDGIAP